MLELMPAQPGAKPELAEGVDGNIDGLSPSGELAIVVLANSVEYTADFIVETEMDVLSKEFVAEVEVFMIGYSSFREYITKARAYSTAAQTFGMHSWN